MLGRLDERHWRLRPGGRAGCGRLSELDCMNIGIVGLTGICYYDEQGWGFHDPEHCQYDDSFGYVVLMVLFVDRMRIVWRGGLCWNDWTSGVDVWEQEGWTDYERMWELHCVNIGMVDPTGICCYDEQGWGFHDLGYCRYGDSFGYVVQVFCLLRGMRIVWRESLFYYWRM